MSGFKLGKMTFGSLFKKPETVLYPVVKPEPPVGLKGHVVVDESTCILCSLCVKRCPCGAIEVDKKAYTNQIPQEHASEPKPGNQDASNQPSPPMRGMFSNKPANPTNKNVVATLPG